MELSDINLLDRDKFTQGVPHEWFTYLRANAPVYKHPEPDGPGFWVVTKYDDVVAVGRDGATYSSDQKRGGVVVLEEPESEMNFEQGGNLMLTMDAPEHTRYRKLVNRGFTPRQMRMLEPHIRELTSNIIDEVIEQGGCDYVVDVAAEVPLQVIAEMLGVPQEDRHKLFEWSNRMIGSEDPEYMVSQEEVMYFRRNVTRDTVLRGQELKEGDKVSIWYISANRDEDKFDRPFEFDILRSPNEHVGFGGGGPHHCLGMNLARMEIYVLLEEMAKRIPTLERTGEAEPLRSNFIAGIKHMPVKYPPGARTSTSS